MRSSIRTNILTGAITIRRPRDPHRAERERARRLSALHGIELEPLTGGGMNVWPPRGMTAADPYDGDHYAIDWEDALERIVAYVKLLEAGV